MAAASLSVFSGLVLLSVSFESLPLYLTGWKATWVTLSSYLALGLLPLAIMWYSYTIQIWQHGLRWYLIAGFFVITLILQLLLAFDHVYMSWVWTLNWPMFIVLMVYFAWRALRTSRENIAGSKATSIDYVWSGVRITAKSELGKKGYGISSCYFL